jgi:ribonuclease HII
MPPRDVHAIPVPDFTREAALLGSGGGPIAGLDEAGRGPWAGPVVAAAVILDPDRIPAGINDSKLLRPEERERLFDLIVASSQVGVGIVAVEVIDRINILNAALGAMRQAARRLGRAPRSALIDGNRCPELRCSATAVVDGDARCLSIAAASIIAKVTRDRIMCALARDVPGYGFERHKGYGTPEHEAALHRLGVTPHHRRSFEPVRELLLRCRPPRRARGRSCSP